MAQTRQEFFCFKLSPWAKQIIFTQKLFFVLFFAHLGNHLQKTSVEGAVIESPWLDQSHLSVTWKHLHKTFKQTTNASNYFCNIEATATNSEVIARRKRVDKNNSKKRGWEGGGRCSLSSVECWRGTRRRMKVFKRTQKSKSPLRWGHLGAPSVANDATWSINSFTFRVEAYDATQKPAVSHSKLFVNLGPENERTSPPLPRSSRDISARRLICTWRTNCQNTF